ncbi:OmpA/MotB family protein [Flavobacteriaceae bacterium 14752]|uniref:OmpA/MotB family protein n=1 Tax=Mesohalobacter salilacus TaxID=2491711 RepID=UPI000F62CB85|nr:hypothetical protein EIG84_12365 [Flavobacteriaceae bacterium 14752]
MKFKCVTILIVLLLSCGSKKELAQAETEKSELERQIAELRSEKEECEMNYEAIEEEVMSYKDIISDLQGNAKNKVELTAGGQLLSEQSKSNVKRILSEMPADQVAQAKTLEDSINLAVGYNIKKDLSEQISEDGLSIDEIIDVKVHEPVVLITLTDKVLFKSGSYWVDKKAYRLLAKISDVINAEPNIDVRVDGHTDNMPLAEGSYIVDNWDLSIRRAASVVRTLENKFGVEGERLIASGRSKYSPVADNSTKSGRARNRRTTILLMPNVKHYMDLINKPYDGMDNQEYNSAPEAKTNQINNSSDSNNPAVEEPKTVVEKEDEFFGRADANNAADKNKTNENKEPLSKTESQTDTVKKAGTTATKKTEAKKDVSNRQNKRLSLREKRAALQREKEEAAKKRREKRERQKDSIRKAIKNRGKDQ